MIDLEKSYIATALEGPVWLYLDFECETCGHRYNRFSLNLSVFFYGVALLAGKNINYVGFTCLSCLRTNLLKGNNLERLKQDLEVFMGPNGSQVFHELRYHSPVPFPPEQIPELKDFNIVSSQCQLSDGDHKDFLNEFNSDPVNDPLLETDYICSYVNNGELPIGTMATILWFKPEQVEALVEIENDHQIRVFPRYIHNMSWYERYDSFCWRYKLYQDYLAGLKMSASETFNSLREHARQNNINLDNLINENPGLINTEVIEYMENQAHQAAANDVTVGAEFLDLLINYDPDPWDVPGAFSDLYKKMWKSVKPFRGTFDKATGEEFDPGKFNPKITDTQVNEIVADIRPHIAKSHVQQWAMDSHLDFINEYISLAHRSDFSYGNVWELKGRYLQRLHKTLDKASIEESMYAFFAEGPTWTIIYNGKKLRGLKGNGFKYIQFLIMNTKKQYHTNQLNEIFGGPEKISTVFDENLATDGKDTDQHIRTDSDAKKQYKARMEELGEIISEAEKNNDLATLDKTSEEREIILSHLRKDFTPTGKPIKFRDDSDKIKDKIVQAIRRAVLRIRKHDSEIADHFQNALKPINNFQQCYKAEKDIDWQFKN